MITLIACMHLCHNKLCVNPTHLRWGNVQENLRTSLLHKQERRGTQAKVELRSFEGMPIAKHEY